MNDIFLLLTLSLSFLILFATMIFIPYWTRKTESFGVSIPQAVYETAPLKKMRKQYALWMSLVSGFILLLFILSYFYIGHDENSFVFFFIGLIFGYLIISFLIYLVFHFKMKKKKEQAQWQADQPQQQVVHLKFRHQKLTLSHAFYILPIGVALGFIIFTLLRFEGLPEQIPMHYNYRGEVTRWAEKSYTNVLIMPIILLFLSSLMLGINLIIAKTKQQISAENPEESLKRNVIFRRRWSIFLYVMTLLLMVLFSLFHVNLFYPLPPILLLILPFIFTFIIIIGALMLSITTGQGGSRIAIESGEKREVIDRDDDQYWKLGQFYYNKEDPSLFIEKRFGIGWTINFARPLAWITLLVIIALSIIIPIVLIE